MSLLQSVQEFVQKKCLLLFTYIIDSMDLEQLASQLDAKQKLITDLQEGVKTTEDLIGKLQSSVEEADKKIADITKSITDNTAAQTLSDQLQSKNTQLQGLVQKFGSSIAPLAAPAISK